MTLDGTRAISASFHGSSLPVWDLRNGTKERELTGHEKGMHAVAVTPDGMRVISASYDHTLRVWNTETGEELAVIALDDEVTAVAVAPNGTMIVAGDREGNVYCLEYVEGEG